MDSIAARIDSYNNPPNPDGTPMFPTDDWNVAKYMDEKLGDMCPMHHNRARILIENAVKSLGTEETNNVVSLSLVPNKPKGEYDG